MLSFPIFHLVLMLPGAPVISIVLAIFLISSFSPNQTKANYLFSRVTSSLTFLPYKISKQRGINRTIKLSLRQLNPLFLGYIRSSLTTALTSGTEGCPHPWPSLVKVAFIWDKSLINVCHRRTGCYNNEGAHSSSGQLTPAMRTKQFHLPPLHNGVLTLRRHYIKKDKEKAYTCR